MKLYTKTGDKGKTRLLTGETVSKSDARIELGGDVDELNSLLGWAVSQGPLPAVVLALGRLQQDLFLLGAQLSGLSSRRSPRNIPAMTARRTRRLEKEIDAFQKRLGPLKIFLRPGGTPAGAALHLARAVCRRMERRLVSLSERTAVPADVLCYVNRLSDHLFVLARFENSRRTGSRPN